MNFLIEYLLIIGKNLLKNKFYAYTRKATLIVKKEAPLNNRMLLFYAYLKGLDKF